MSGKKVPIVSSTKQSKIVRYKLEEECVNLKKAGLSLSEIANELSSNEKVPPHDKIDKFVVARFLEKIPNITKQLVQEDKRRLLEVVNTNFDIMEETGRLFAKSKSLLDLLEDDAYEKGKIVNVYMWKAVVSEMREMLRQMTEIQKEINDYDNVRKFMEIVLQVLQEEAPDKIPIIADKLRVVKGTQWFASIMSKSKDGGDS